MKLDVEALKFGGLIVGITERELSASINDDKDDAFVNMIYEKYKAEGSPKNKKKWLRDELKKHFVYATKPPVWIERLTSPPWPFFNGKPMVFIEQIEVPDNEVTNAETIPRTMLYVFASKQPVDDGWTPVYRVIDQVPGL